MYEITEELINKILTLLGQMPYIQSAKLIQEIQSGIKKIEVEAPNADL